MDPDPLLKTRPENLTPLALQVIGVALAVVLIGPFGQADRFLLTHRAGLWLFYLLAGLPMLALILMALRRRVPGRGVLRSCAVIGLSVLLASPLLLAMVEAIGLVEGRPLPSGLRDYGRALLEAAVLALPFAVLLDRGLNLFMPEAVRAAVPTAKAIDVTRFGDIHAFSAEGHYVRLFTAQGERFVDVAFSEMLAACRSLNGAQVHRSWWVAQGEIDVAGRKGSSAEIRLRSGLRVPVARRRLRALRQRGWSV